MACTFPKRRQDLYKENGWGYKDCYFYYDKAKKSLMFRGDRYKELGHRTLGRAAEGIQKIYSIDISQLNSGNQIKPSPDDYKLIDNLEFREKLGTEKIDYSMSFEDRFYRGHAQSSIDIFTSVYGSFKRIPDVVVWPRNHDEVVKVVNAANESNVAIIVYGGGSNVTSSTKCPESEKRMIVSLDTTQMNRLLWINEESMLASFESGVSGQDLEKILNSKGYTMGHEPDSIEFSTLGGWIATKSSGLKQQKYGNIEDIVVKMKFVTSVGVFEHEMTTPRNSSGPDFERLLIGSEGTLGVVTEAVFRINRRPKCQKFGSLIFPDHKAGIKFLHECTKSDWLPSNLRLFCNKNVQTGLSMESTDSVFTNLAHPVKLFFIKNYLKFDENKFTSASFMIEGDDKTVEWKSSCLRKIASKFGGFFTGENVAKLSYTASSSYSIYLRDVLFKLGTIVDTVETSIIWSNLEKCIESVEKKYVEELLRLNLKGYVLYRISQIYKEGVCLYIYYGVHKCDNQVEKIHHMTDFVKDVILKCGGSLSHHHGIGTKNTERYNSIMPPLKKDMLRHLKNRMDPKNVFCVENFFERQKEEVVAGIDNSKVEENFQVTAKL